MARTRAFPLLAAPLLIAILLIALSGCSGPGDEAGTEGTSASAERSEASGAYLGQSPPWLTTEVFAPGIVSLSSNESAPSFTLDGNELYFFRREDEERLQYVMTQVDGRWTGPTVVPFSREYAFAEANISPDGLRMFLSSPRSVDGAGESEHFDLWVMERADGAWNEPKHLGPAVNSEDVESFPVISLRGDLYFFGECDGKRGCEILVSRFVDDTYSEPEILGSGVNSDKHEVDPSIAPDESFLVFCVRDREDGLGNNDLYVSFREEDSSWSQSVNLGPEINSTFEELTPQVTPDGKYLFFASNRNGNWDLFWVDTEMIKALRPNGQEETGDLDLGQSPPGLTPEVFAPGIVSRADTSDGCSAVSPEAGVVIFNRYLPDTPYPLYLTELRDGAWTAPAPAPFNSEYNDWDSNFAPDGRTFYFTSRRPAIVDGQPATSSNIWVTSLTSTAWTEPRVLEYPVNIVEGWSGHPSVARDGTIYFHSGRDGEEGDIFRARQVNGAYPEVENLGAPVNTELGDIDPYIAPDSSYLVFLSGEPRDLHIAFRNDDGSWSQPTRLPEARHGKDT